MDISKQEYNQLIQAHARPSPLVRDMLWAFFVGGAICTLGQVLRNLYESLGLSGDDAGILVPITGFANAMVSPALEFKSEGYITGTAAKLFVVAGPVLVFGISASVIYGLICFFFGL